MIQPDLTKPEPEEVQELTPSNCLMCNGNEFAWIAETGHLICWHCGTGFLPHEYPVLQNTSNKVN